MITPPTAHATCLPNGNQDTPDRIEYDRDILESLAAGLYQQARAPTQYRPAASSCAINTAVRTGKNCSVRR